MKKLHICIITGQPLANLIPLLQEKPDNVYLLHSDDKKMTAAAQSFSRTLEEAGFKLEKIHIYAGLPTHSFDAIRLYAMEIHDKIRQKFPESQLIWNATGGTKLMALAMWDVLDKNTGRVIYTKTQDGLLEELTSEAGTKPLNSLLTPKLYLSALGKIKRRAESDGDDWCERANTRKAATRHLGDNAESLASLIQHFNRQLDSDDTELQTLALDRIGPQWRKALQQLEDADLFVQVGDGKYHTARRDSARYLTGGWLEEYVWHTAKNQGVDYVEIGLKFGDYSHRKQGQDNEIDAFIVHQNRLLLVECKSGHMGRDSRKDGDIIYKLDSIGLHAGGTQATRLLISSQLLQHDTKAGRKVDTRARASATDIHTLEASELKKLGERIRHWKEKGQWPTET